MILNNSVKIKNYKCFGSEEQGFDKIYPLNIIIGKNNSGKSSLLDLIDYLVRPNNNFLNIGRDKFLSEVIIGDTITDEYIDKSFPKDSIGGGIPGNHHVYGLTLVGQNIKYRLEEKSKHIFHWDQFPVERADVYISKMIKLLNSPLSNKKFFRITAERDITPEGANYSEVKLFPNGRGATNLIRHVVNNADQNLNLIRKVLLNALNEITLPDIEYVNIAPREFNNNWEIFLEDKNELLIPLSKMGSGVKTILLVLLNLLVLPEIEKVQKSQLVFGFEELENNLHPSIQRRLLNYISIYSKKECVYFFITTHSSIVIDLFDWNPDAQIVHVQSNGVSSVVKRIETHEDGRGVLKDLDFKSSDILMSNGIVWVEGPSDAIYFRLLIELFIQSQEAVNKKKLNYTIQSLSTAIWKYAGFAEFNWENVDESVENKIISLERLNLNQLIIIDRDDNYEDLKPSKWDKMTNGTGRNKARLIYELMKFCGHNEDLLINNFGETESTLFFWVNDGTIETYLEHFINTKGKDKFGKYFDFSKKRGYFEKKSDGENHSISKIELSHAICQFCVDSKFVLEDIIPQNSPLYNMLLKLYNTINSWN